MQPNLVPLHMMYNDEHNSQMQPHFLVHMVLNVCSADNTSNLSCIFQDAFIGYGGNVVREKVKNKASWFVTDFQELISALQTSTNSSSWWTLSFRTSLFKKKNHMVFHTRLWVQKKVMTVFDPCECTIDLCNQLCSSNWPAVARLFARCGKICDVRHSVQTFYTKLFHNTTMLTGKCYRLPLFHTAFSDLDPG